MRSGLIFLAFIAFWPADGSFGQDAPKTEPEPKKPAAPYKTARDAPLKAEEKVVNEADDHTQYRVEFEGIKEDRVPAFLYVPKRKPKDPPAPAILLQYGTGGSKTTDYIVAIGKQFVSHGFVVLTIDAPGRGERRKKDKNAATGVLALLDGNDIMHYCGDYGRAIDFLVTRPEVDKERIGYVGISWGAITGITFVAYDERVKAMGSIVGGGNFLAGYTPKAAEKAKLEGSKSPDPVFHVARIAPRPLLFINCKKDQLIMKPWAESLHKAAGEGSKVVWLDSDHYLKGLDRAAICDSVIEFMHKSMPAAKGTEDKK
jgi:dienelactone hydrolase